MSRQMPVGVILVSIWFFVAGLVEAGTGAVGAFFLNSLFGWLGFSNPLQIISIVFLIIGLVMIASALGYWIGAVGLLMGKEWGRVGTMISCIGGAVGWIASGLTILLGVVLASGGTMTGLAIGTTAFPIVFGILNALPILVLRSDDVRQYTGAEMAEYYPPPPTYVPATAPAPVIVSPPTPLLSVRPVVTSVPSPQIPPTEVLGVQQPPAAWLVARSGSRKGKDYGLQRGRNTIGRDGTQCDIVLDETTVSKQHAEVRYENGQFVLYDLASTNGTFVNNRRTQRQSLLDGDDVRFGSTAFIFKQVKLR